MKLFGGHEQEIDGIDSYVEGLYDPDHPFNRVDSAGLMEEPENYCINFGNGYCFYCGEKIINFNQICSYMEE